MLTTLRRVYRRLIRVARNALAHPCSTWLDLTAQKRRRSVVDPRVPVVVSLTSYGDRLRRAHVTIESIARGSVRPGRLVLWLDPDEDATALPLPLRRLERRGLEVRNSPWDVGPHKKYLPVVCAPARPALPLVTADDDVIYPRRWLAELVTGARRTPDLVIAHRVRDLVLDDSGAIAPYNSWPMARGTAPAFRRFPTGSGGTLYPVAVQLRLRELGLGFTTCCPRADDLWLHHTVITSGIRARQVRCRSRTFLEVPGTQVHALNHENTGRNANDVQIRSTYSADAVALLRTEAARDADTQP